MAHARFEFEMPAACETVFDAFHYHCWRHRWDSLVRDTQVIGGGEHPEVGSRTHNAGAGWLAALSMHTVFLSYDRPRLAAAQMEGRSFPFAQWAASMRHKPLAPGRSLMIYTYTFTTIGPRWMQFCLEPVVRLVFDRQTRRRFGRLQRFLQQHAAEVENWQRGRQERR